MKNKLITLALILFLLVGGTALAQVNPNEGRILGRVLDDQGNPLPGVSVEATSPKLVGKAATVTDNGGYFRLLALPSGTYEITFTLQGFKTIIRKDIILKLGDTINVNVNMEPAAIEEQITVVGQSPLIDVKSTVKGQVMTKETFLSLPRGRDFGSLITLVPGVSYESNVGGYSFDGATASENMWYVDGADVTNIHIGLKGQNVVLEMIDEVKVTAAGYNAEFGGSMGGVVNVITRSGGNAFHGDLMGFYDNNERYMLGKSRTYLRTNPYNSLQYLYWNDDDKYFNGGKDRDNYYGGEIVLDLGGYIIKDKLWFFASANPIYRHQTGLRDFNQRQGPFRSFTYKSYDLNGSIKLTAAPVAGLRISASYVNNFSTYKGTFPSLDGTSLDMDEYGKEGFDYPNWTGSFTADYSASNNLLISLRGGWHQYNTTDQKLKPISTLHYFVYGNTPFASQYTDPSLVHYSGWMNHLWSSRMNSKKMLQDKISSNLDVTYYVNFLGEHAFKAGAQFIYLHEDYDNMADYPIVYYYWNRSTTALGFTIGRGGTGDNYGQYGYYIVRSNPSAKYGYYWNIHSNNWALYLQDSWTISNKLTINYGLRTESEYVPAFAPNDPHNPFPGYSQKPINFKFSDKLAPRFGVVYDVFGDSSLKLFANFGVYYDVMKLYLAEGSFGGFKWISEYYTLNDLDWRKIGAHNDITSRTDIQGEGTGNLYRGSIDFRYPSFDSIDPDLKPVSQSEFSFGAEKKLAENLSLNARFTYKHLIRTIEDVGVYVRDPETGANYEMYYLTNPGYGYSRPAYQGGKFADYVLDDEGNSYAYWPEPKAKREYYALNISLDKRFSNNWQGGISYTLSRLEGNYSGLSSADEWGRNSPNVERFWDYWFMMYDAYGKPLDGPLPQDRTHYIKAYGSYTFPFGLTLGITGYCRSGLQNSSKLWINNTYMYPFNYADLPRNPWTVWADLFAEYNFKIGGKYTLGINLQINNITNTKTIQRKFTDMNYGYLWMEDWEILRGDLANNLMYWLNNNPPSAVGYEYTDTRYYRLTLADGTNVPVYNQWRNRFDTWSARIGFKFTF